MISELSLDEIGHVCGGTTQVFNGPNGTIYIRDNGDGTVTTQVQRSDGSWTQPITGPRVIA